MEKRYNELDSLRGIAALLVLSGHFFTIFPSIGDFVASKIRALSPFFLFGHPAVILFFILSGFVLSLSFFKEKKPQYQQYILKRLCRIYIPYLLIILLALLIKSLLSDKLGHIPSMVAWGNWTGDITLNLVLQHILFLGEYNSDALVMVVWSLVHEMRVSIIFPFLMFLIIRANWKLNVAVAIGLSVVSYLLIIYFPTTYSKPISTNYAITLHYTSMFIIGSLIARYRENLTKLCTHGIQYLFFPIGLFFFYYSNFPYQLLNKIVGGINDTLLQQLLHDWIITIGGAIIIVLAINIKLFSKILLLKPIRYIGTISYSLYLTHPVVLLTLVYSLYGVVTVPYILMISLFISICVAHLCYKFIEKPSIRLGEYLTKKLTLVKQSRNNIRTDLKTER